MKIPDQELYLRQLLLYSPMDRNPRITVIGAGGIGSNVVVLLSMLGVKRITVMDADIVVGHNLNTTPYRQKDLGQPKVLALKSIMKSRIEIKAIRKMFRKRLPESDIVISGVDSMDVRRDIFKSVVRAKVPFFIDGRIGGENLRVYAVRPGEKNDRDQYKLTLVKNKYIVPLPCTAEQVCDIGYLTASLVVRAVRRWEMAGIYNLETIVDPEFRVMLSPLRTTHPVPPPVEKLPLFEILPGGQSSVREAL